jgi:hypothetical protein
MARALDKKPTEEREWVIDYEHPQSTTEALSGAARTPEPGHAFMTLLSRQSTRMSQVDMAMLA